MPHRKTKAELGKKLEDRLRYRKAAEAVFEFAVRVSV